MGSGLPVVAGRMAYVAMCLSLCWGVLATTGWVVRITGRAALHRSHATLAVLAIACAFVHAVSPAFLAVTPQLTPATLVVPFHPAAPLRWTPGILAVELAVAVALSVFFRRFLDYLHWLRFHRVGYPAVALGVAHAWLSAAAGGHLAAVWLAGLTVLAPAALLAALRCVPPEQLARIGLLSS